MKQVIAIIRPNMYYKTKDALVENNFYSLTTKEVLGRGHKKPEFETGSGEMITSDFHPFVAKKLLEIFCRDEDTEKLIETIRDVNKTGHPGDGKIFVIDIEDGIRIRTGESGVNSIM